MLWDFIENIPVSLRNMKITSTMLIRSSGSIAWFSSYDDDYYLRSESIVIHNAPLTLVLLNKLRCHTLFKFSANQITCSDCWYKFNTEWQTVQIQISWLLKKPTDLDLHCLQRQVISGFSRTRVNLMHVVYKWNLRLDAALTRKNKIAFIGTHIQRVFSICMHFFGTLHLCRYTKRLPLQHFINPCPAE